MGQEGRRGFDNFLFPKNRRWALPELFMEFFQRLKEPDKDFDENKKIIEIMFKKSRVNWECPWIKKLRIESDRLFDGLLEEPRIWEQNRAGLDRENQETERNKKRSHENDGTKDGTNKGTTTRFGQALWAVDEKLKNVWFQ